MTLDEERPPTAGIGVVIIEDQRAIREGLRFMIDATAGYRCTGCFGSMEEALSAFGRARPRPADVALVDIGLPGMSGIDGIRLLVERVPDMVTIVLTVYEDDHRIFEALCAGAAGYLLKKTAPARLLECLREATLGGAPMSPEVASRVIRVFKEFQPPRQADYHLTPHELRLLGLLGDGHSYKTAAASLGSSINTVSFHMRSIYAKLQVHSKSEAVAKALRDRLIR